MAPTLVREPFHRDGWVYEEKVDGWRILAYKDGARVRLVSRNGRDHARRFADLAVAISKLSARTLVLDGEVAIYDRQLRSRFDWLRDPDTDVVAWQPFFIALGVMPTIAMRTRNAGSHTSASTAIALRSHQSLGTPHDGTS